MSTENEAKKPDAGACGPGCGCGASGAKGNGKAIGIVVAVIACALVARALVKSQGPAKKPHASAGFAGLPAAAPAIQTAAAGVLGKETAESTVAKAALAEASAGQAVAISPAGDASAKPMVASAVGEVPAKPSVAIALTEIGAILELNQVAMGSKGVFLYVAAKGPSTSKAPMESMLAAARKIEQQAGGKIGMFTLKVGSPDYEMVTAQMAAPGVLVLVPGGRLVPVTGEITETKLIQGFLSSVQSCGAGGCGPRGCG